MKLRIGHLSTFYHTAILLMAGGNMSSRFGVEIEWKLFGTGPAIVDAFSRDQLDLAYIGLPPAIIGIARGVAITCVAGGHMEGTVMTGKSRWKGFPEVDDLKAVLSQFSGRRIGVPGKGSIHDVILKESLSRFRLESDIEVVNFPWADLVIEAVVRDEVDAAFGTPALAVAVRRFAGGKVLYPPSRLWPCNPSYGIVVDREYLSGNKEVLEKFLALHEEATDLVRNSPEEAARMIAEYVGIIDREFVLDTLKVSPKYCAALTEGYISSTMDFVKALRRLGYIGREPGRAEIFDVSLIEKIHPQPDHYSEGIHM